MDSIAGRASQQVAPETDGLTREGRSWAADVASDGAVSDLRIARRGVVMSPTKRRLSKMSASKAGFSRDDQIGIALVEIARLDGTAQMAQLYEALERAMNAHGATLSVQGHTNLRNLVNKVAVNEGYIRGYDKRSPGWRITSAGRSFIEDDESEPGWEEGDIVLRVHRRRERARTLAKAKRDDFRRKHNGRLYCENCKRNPSAYYKGPAGDAAIDVHHKATAVSEMKPGHQTKLKDLVCLCANCHRVEHRRAVMARAASAKASSDAAATAR